MDTELETVGMNTWQIGRFTITRVPELAPPAGVFDGLIPQATPEEVRSIEWLYPDYVNENGQVLFSVHPYLLKAADLTILVDAGCGNNKSAPIHREWDGLNTPFLHRLKEAGAEPGEIDLVISTHLHLDHVGWNTVLRDGEWVPTFPNARYIFVRDELEYQREVAAEKPADKAGWSAEDDYPNQVRIIFEESLQPCIDAGLVDVVDSDHQISPELRYISTPGHTRGHCSLVIESEGERAVITGDFIHHPVQIARPPWSSANDWNREKSAASRSEFYSWVADADILVLGTHFRGSSGGRVVTDGEYFRYVRVG